MRRGSITLSILDISGAGTAARKNIRWDYRSLASDEVLTMAHGVTVTGIRSGSGQDTPGPNTLPSNAVSFCYVDTSLPDCNGLPTGAGTILDYWSFSDQYRTQLLSMYGRSNLYFRIQNGDQQGAWSQWFTFYHTGNKPTSDDVGALSVNGGTITGTIFAHAGDKSRAIAYCLSNNATAVGHCGLQMEVHATGSMDIATTDGANWFYPITFQRNSHDMNFGGNVTSTGLLTFGSAVFNGTYQNVSGQNGWGYKIVGNTGCAMTSLERPAGADQYAGIGVHQNGSIYIWNCESAKDYAAMFEPTKITLNRRTIVNSSLNVNNGVTAQSITVSRQTSNALITDTPIAYGTGNSIVRGAVAGGAYATWVNCPAGLLVDCDDTQTNAVLVWKATKWGTGHLAGMSVLMPDNNPSSAEVVLHLGNGHTQFKWETNGNFTASGNGYFNDVYIKSDIRDKRNLKYINNPLERIKNLTGAFYDIKTSNGWNKSGGLIAQQIRDTSPELVQEKIDYKGESRLRVNYNGVIGLLVNAVNSLNRKCESLSARLSEHGI